MNEQEQFELANKAYALMTPPERLCVLSQFARLRYPDVRDRFFEAVYRVVRNGGDPVRRDDSAGGGTPREPEPSTR